MKIYKQYHKIDVLLIVNEEYAVIIEDKVNSKEHSNQLNIYKEDFIKNEDKLIKNFKEENLLLLYFKTGDQACYEDIKKDGYNIFSRQDFLNILSNYQDKIKSDIYNDFYQYLSEIQNQVELFKKKPMEQWNWRQWQGFFKQLQKEKNLLYENCWGYVSNSSGGFWGFWWNELEIEDYKIHLQLEKNKLCFKVYVNDESLQSSIRNMLYEKIKDNKKIMKPRFRKGTYMTFAIMNTLITMDNYRDVISNAEKIFEGLK